MRLQILIVGVVAAGICFCAVSATVAFAQVEPAAAVRNEQAEATLAAGSTIFAELNAGLDSKKLKAGDAIAAHATEALKSSDGRTIIPRGAKLEGHVTQADARSKGGSASTLGIQFDKAILKDGGEIALNVAIQAIAPRQFSDGPKDEPGPTSIGTNQTSPMSGGHAPAQTGAPQGADGSAAAGNSAGLTGPRLDARSRGAVGMKGITLDGAVVEGRAATVV